jgi:hypothetical protein
MDKYRNSVEDRGSLQKMIDKVIDMYNDTPHRGLKGKTSNQLWGNTKEQEKKNMIETMYNDKIFNKMNFGTGDLVRVLLGRG